MRTTRRRRTQRTLKWFSTAACGVLLAVWLASRWYEASLVSTGETRAFSVRIGRGEFQAMGYDDPITGNRSGLRLVRGTRAIFYGSQLLGRDGLHQGRTIVQAPLWILVLLAGILSVHLWWRDRRFAPGRCPACGYDLTGLPAPAACPECGGMLKACGPPAADASGKR